MRSPVGRVGAVVVAVLAGLLVAPVAEARAPAPSRLRAGGAPMPLHLRSAAAEVAIVGDGVTALRPNTMGSGRETWAPAAPSTTFGFDAIPRIGGNWPADPTGAIGDTSYLTAVNTHWALYDLTGAPLLGPGSLQGLFDLPVGSDVFDPKVVYDPYLDTYVLGFLGVNDAQQESWILVVTIPDATASDTGTWCGTRIAADRTRGDGRQWADYPSIGFSADRVAITSNQFNFAGDGFSSAQILSFRKSNLYECSQDPRFETFVGPDTQNPDRTKAFTLQAATSAGANPTAQFLVSIEDRRRQDLLVLWRLKAQGGRLVLKRGAIEVPRFRIGPYGTQCGGGLNQVDTWWDPGDTRLVTAFFDADLGRVYTAHAIGKDLGPDPVTGGYRESVVRWYEVRPERELRRSDLTRTGVIGAPETDAGWPALATDAAGNLFVTYSRASRPNRECLSAWAAQIGPTGKRAETMLLAAGRARFEALTGPERWGDYNAVSRDPVGGTFVAMVNQYAADDGGRSTIDWQQTVDVVSAGETHER